MKFSAFLNFIIFLSAENSTIDYVIFETSNTLKEAVIREWNYMNIDNINSIPNYLLQHVLNHPNLAVFVREKILQVRLPRM